MSYLPKYVFSKTIEQYHSPSYKAALLSDILSHDIKYKYLLMVYKKEEEEPFMAISSERFSPQSVKDNLDFMGDLLDDLDMNAETHFLCTFVEGKHRNLGDTKDWSDLLNFKYTALNLIEDYLEEKFQINVLEENLVRLSLREKRILFYMRQGLGIREIAEKMNKVHHSIHNFSKTLMAKFRITRLGELRMVAQELNITEEDLKE